MNIELSNCPEILQKAVEEKVKDYGKFFGGYKIISVTMRESTPYKDKSIVSKDYAVYIMAANSFVILKYEDNPGEHFNLGVMDDSVNIGEIEEIVNNAPEWFRFKEPVGAY
jgi:hypothetical protein